MHAVQDHYADPILDDIGGREVIIDNRDNSATLEEYQVSLEMERGHVFFDADDGLQFVNENLQIIDSWKESLPGAVWLEVPKISGSTMCALRMLDRKPSAVSTSDGDNTFLFFDNFTTTKGKYITNWTKHASNPLQTKTCQNWLIAVYSNYNNEDKIYIFEQRNAHPSNNIECWSFTRANAATPAQWTDHGVVFTGSSAHDDGHIEPHGIVFETQYMADAREGVGAGLGTRKWRLYYCAKGVGEGTDKYSANFIYASESDLTSWTAYTNNPVYDHDSEWGFADSKVCIHDDKVWMHHCKYKFGTSCDPSFFSVSDDGISSWTDKTKNWATERTVLGTLIPFSTGILLTGNPATPDRYAAYFTTDGDDKESYSGNPILSLGGGGQWDDADLHWCTIVIDKNGSADLNAAGTYYMYYIGYDGAINKLGLATSTTLIEESGSVLDSDKWTLDGSPAITAEILTIQNNGLHGKSDYGMNHSCRYRAKKYSPIGGGNWDAFGIFGFDDSMDLITPYEDFAMKSGNSDLYVLSDEAYSSSLGAGMLDKWAIYEILRKATSHEFLIDAVSKHTETSPHTGDLAPTFWSGSSKEKIEIDWVLVRKYSSPEPTAKVGEMI